MLRTLLKKQLMEIFRNYFFDQKKNKGRSKTSTLLYFAFFAVVMIGIVGGMFYYLASALCGGLVTVGFAWLYFVIMGLLSVLLGLFGSVFNTYTALYRAKDNDFLLAMPIPVRNILISRLLSVYLLGVLYSAVVIVPTVLVYFTVAPFTVGALLGSLVLTVLISIVVFSLSCLLGLVVAKISSKLKNKSYITVIISLAGIALYYFFYFKAQEIISDLVANVAVYGEQVQAKAYPLYLFGKIGEGDLFSIAVIGAVVLTVTVLILILLGKTFMKIATQADVSTVKGKNLYRHAKQQSVFTALLKKEFSRFTASPNYMLNCGLGVVFLPAAGIFFLIKGSGLLNALSDAPARIGNGLPVLAVAVLCLLNATNDMAAPSVSLESKSIWVVQSLPVGANLVLRAKVTMQMILAGIPTLFVAACFLTVIPTTPFEGILFVLTALIDVIFLSVLFVFLNVKMPNLTWTNEMYPVKQSASVVLSLLGGMAYGAAVGGIYLGFGYHLGSTAYLAITATVTAIAAILIFLWLETKGSKIFERLSV